LGIQSYLPYELLIPISIILSLGIALYLTKQIVKLPSGTEKMVYIYKAIREGSTAYLKRQYKVVIPLLMILTGIIYVAIDFNIHSGMPYVSASFLMGTLMSLLAGYLSMDAATKANVKTAQAARESETKPLVVAFRGGMVLGLSVVALSLAGVAGLFYLYWYMTDLPLYEVPLLIMGYGFGASLAALFAQLGGGIYTKSADLGADLVGKVEVGIPEDDPRNPAVIADNVGDNVGDCAGRGADLFESISAENIGSMIIGASLYLVAIKVPQLAPYAFGFIIFPIVARAVGLIASIIGAYMVRPKEGEHPIVSLRNGLIASSVLAAIFMYPTVIGMLGPYSEYLYIASVLGIVAALIIEVLTEYYTGDHKPVLGIVESTKTGSATTILSGFSVGLSSTGLPVITVLTVLGISYFLGMHYASLIGIAAHIGGIYGTVAATIGILSLTGIILAIDGYGPIADNAGGILEMSGLEDSVGHVNEILDAVGNTTKALAKGFAMGSALMAALLLFQAYVDVIKFEDFNLMMPSVLIGVAIGIMLPFVFSSYAINAVSKAAHDMINEVRRQFREIPGILEGKTSPEYGKCVDIATKAAQREMILPSLLVMVAPIVVGLILGAKAVAGLLVGTTFSGGVLAYLLFTGGAAWDNAKKYIERSGRKGTEEHKAAVVGDTVGDPFKDTAGPSLHIVIKLVNNVAIVFAMLFVLYGLHLLP
jgi:K(+)-stimulated pyrophosphate-energized sodium pump